MVFFPSYKYMLDTYKCFLGRVQISTGISQENFATTEPAYGTCSNIPIAISQENPIQMEEAPSRKIEAQEGILIQNLIDYPFTLYKQNTTMSEEEREAFLNHFEDIGEATLNFCVLGGILLIDDAIKIDYIRVYYYIIII